MDNIVSENGKTLSFQITKPRFSDNAYLLQPLSDTTYLLQQIYTRRRLTLPAGADGPTPADLRQSA